MTPRVKFQLDETKLALLRSFLEHPVMLEAFSVVSYETVPVEPTAMPGVDLSQQMSIAGAKAVGANQFKKLLLSLTDKPLPRPPSPQSNNESKAYEILKNSGLWKDETQMNNDLDQ